MEGDVGAGESRRPVNVAGERNALRQRRRIASRAAGGGVWQRSSVTVLEKKQNDTNERAAMLALKSRCSACGERVGAPF